MSIFNLKTITRYHLRFAADMREYSAHDRMFFSKTLRSIRKYKALPMKRSK